MWIPSGSDSFIEKGKTPSNPDAGKAFLYCLSQGDRLKCIHIASKPVNIHVFNLNN